MQMPLSFFELHSPKSTRVIRPEMQMLSYVKTKQCSYSPISPRHAIGITEGSPAYGVRVR
jgi:hypothetical protein